jgi:hypothetical protein
MWGLVERKGMVVLAVYDYYDHTMWMNEEGSLLYVTYVLCLLHLLVVMKIVTRRTAYVI